MLTKVEAINLMQHYLDVFNSHEPERLSEILTDNYVNHTRIGTFDGLDSFKQICKDLFTAFPDIKYFADKVLVDGDQVTLLYHWTGTHRGLLFGIPATNNKVVSTGMELNRFENGKVAETSNFSDLLGMMQQLGAIPAIG